MTTVGTNIPASIASLFKSFDGTSTATVSLIEAMNFVAVIYPETNDAASDTESTKTAYDGRTIFFFEKRQTASIDNVPDMSSVTFLPEDQSPISKP